MHFLPYDFRHRAIAGLSKVPTWTRLNTLGQSKLVSLTILIPFLGSLLLFNQQLIDFLSIAPELIVRSTRRADQVANEASRAATLTRLYFTYFGLSMLGIGSFLFIIFCPQEIRNYENIHSYIDAEQPRLTRARLGLLLYYVAEDHIANTTQSGEQGPWYREMAYPNELYSLFYRVFTAIFMRVTNDDPDIIQSDDNFDGSPFFTHRGNVDVRAVADILWSDRQVDRAIGESFADKAMDNLVDVLTMRYIALDCSRPILRIVVNISYGLGFAILFIPTVSTFFAVLQNVLGS